MSDATPEPQDAAEALDGDKVADDDGFVDDEITVIPPDRPLGLGSYGTTASEDAVDEPLAERADHEQPEVWDDTPRPGAGTDQVGRLVEPDLGMSPDTEPDAVAEAVGDRPAELAAEEDAVHLTAEPPLGDGDGYVEDEAGRAPG
jgi:hypothetical protein